MKSMYISVYEPAQGAPAYIIGNFSIKTEDLNFYKGYANDSGKIRFTVYKSTKPPYDKPPYAGITIQVQEPYNNRQTNKRPESEPIDKPLTEEEIPF